MGRARQYTFACGKMMNFTFTWILDKFGFQPKIETFDFPIKSEPVAKKATTVAKKIATKKTVAKKTVQKKT
jgi:hypothetical protein